MPELRPARVAPEVVAGAGYFLPRLMFLNARHAPQVHWGDVARALDGLTGEAVDLGSPAFWKRWRAGWCAVGTEHAERAAAGPTPATRRRAHRAAAACFHWAEFMDFDDPAAKTALRERTREHFRTAVAEDDLDAVEGLLPATDDDPAVSYWLLRPPAPDRAAGPLPCVILSNGLDSMTEVEVLSLAEAYLERGMAALIFDGPGQGLLLGRVPLRVEMETVVARLVSVLGAEPDIDTGNLGFVGVSFGGYLALRVARTIGRSFRCVVNFSGGPRVAPFTTLPRRLKDDFRFALEGGDLGGDDAHMQARLDALALSPQRPPRTEVLSVHGALDDIFPLAELAELDRAWGARHRLLVHPREAHVCLTRLESCAQDTADWVAERLTAGAGALTRAA